MNLAQSFDFVSSATEAAPLTGPDRDKCRDCLRQILGAIQPILKNQAIDAEKQAKRALKGVKNEEAKAQVPEAEKVGKKK